MSEFLVCNKYDLRKLVRESVLKLNPDFPCPHEERHMIRISDKKTYGCRSVGYEWVFFCRSCRMCLISQFWFTYDGEPEDPRYGRMAIMRTPECFNYYNYNFDELAMEQSLMIAKPPSLKTLAARSFTKDPVFVYAISDDVIEYIVPWLWYFKYRV